MKQPSLKAKPQYSKVGEKTFGNKAEATSYAKKKRQEFKAAEESVKYDISRTNNSDWKVTLFVKV